ncbi:N-formylmaleamate deformylase [Pseudonocardia ammonioxydans]|uniref:N-formylmaleamate deformylase n=1 Tax=Pseudonocardia ammonioxydans TaxID=260086 RepID=A0A1I4ZT53_PSUAM|nr:alpha/beta fold hydrolase [Pseudonocardia ammonioxydans]SFN53412.1 N-formylmaleamate deformylase [Pseudonocardia ammonioxydans]
MMTVDEIRAQRRTVDTNGLRHSVLDYGAGAAAARDLLVLPGITTPAVCADFLATRLTALGFRVVVPDVRGRGESDRAAPGGYRLVDYAADVAGLVDVLDLRAPLVLGHSMGARIAAAYAVHHAPDDHGPLVLVDPPTSGPGRAPYPTTREAFLDQLRAAQAGTTADGVAAFYPGWPRRELELRARHLATCDETAVVETHRGFETEDFFRYWTELRGTVLLVHGADSPVVPPDAVDELRGSRPDIPVVPVTGAGHMVPWDELDQFLDLLTPHLLTYRENQE